MRIKADSKRRQGGAVAVVFALAMVTLLGMVGLALDMGKLYVTKGELQNSADSCALAAARELTGSNMSLTQLTIAEAAGITAGGANKVYFQSEAANLEADSSVTFSTASDGPFVTKAAAAGTTVGYVRCGVERPDLPNFLVQILNWFPGTAIGNKTVVAFANASLVPSQTNCALPIGICAADLASKAKGDWLEGLIGPPGGGGLSGNFKWIDFTPPSGGASELAAILSGSGVCNVPATGAQVGQPGNVSSAARDWNTRFGIYANSIQPSSAVPDYSGYAYTETNWPTMKNAYSDFKVKRDSFAAYQGNTSTGLRIPNNNTIEGSNYLQTNGADRRLGIMPVVDCTAFASSSTAPVTKWACILMLHPLNTSSGGSGTGSTRMFVEYVGLANEADSPCATLGTPGGTNSAGSMVPALVQ